MPVVLDVVQELLQVREGRGQLWASSYHATEHVTGVAAHACCAEMHCLGAAAVRNTVKLLFPPSQLYQCTLPQSKPPALHLSAATIAFDYVCGCVVLAGAGR
jgi:hypothetical protein